MSEKNISTKEVKGLNLNIDSQILKLCEISNSSSSHTRGTLYISVLVSLISLVAVLNTSLLTNWTKERIETDKSDYLKFLDSEDCTNSARKLELETQLIKQVQLKPEKIDLIQIPIIGNVFDVNNLSYVAGLSFVIILYHSLHISP